MPLIALKHRIFCDCPDCGRVTVAPLSQIALQGWRVRMFYNGQYQLVSLLDAVEAPQPLFTVCGTCSVTGRWKP